MDRICRLDESARPLVLRDMPDPTDGAKEVLVKVTTCGVFHTEVEEIEGRTPPPNLPVVLGHQVVGRVESDLLN